jgi:hypothetical protein
METKEHQNWCNLLGVSTYLAYKLSDFFAIIFTFIFDPLPLF